MPDPIASTFDPDLTVKTQPEPSWTERSDTPAWYDRFPWWSVILFLLWSTMLAKILFDDDYDLAWKRISPGVTLTIRSTFSAFGLATTLGLILGLGRTLQTDDRTNPLVRFIKIAARNICRTYIEFIRGIPILPLIMTVALVIIPSLSESVGLKNKIPFEWRAIIALALIYGAYIAEIIRAGVQSVDQGQVEAGRSLGLTRGATTRSIVLPQAIRNVIPPLGNDFIAILKDTSLLSVLGVLELTQLTKQFANSSFKFREGYLVLTFIYLSLTIVLSLLLQQLEKYMMKDKTGAR
jgi:polar amino acid transport system permease protein